MNKQVTISTDGACRGNPGPGGWGALMEFGDSKKSIKGAEAETTNNRMELMAAIASLEALTRECDVKLITDSKYVMQGMNEWIKNWKKNNWKTAAKKPVKNVDLWQRLDTATQKHNIKWEWVKGHTGHPGNERADELANEAIDEMLQNA